MDGRRGHQDAAADEVRELFPQLSNPADQQHMVATLAENTIEAVLRPDLNGSHLFQSVANQAP